MEPGWHFVIYIFINCVTIRGKNNKEQSVGASHHSLDVPVEGAPARRAGKTDTRPLSPGGASPRIQLTHRQGPCANSMVMRSHLSSPPPCPAVQFSRNPGESTSEPIRDTQHSICSIKKYAHWLHSHKRVTHEKRSKSYKRLAVP